MNPTFRCRTVVQILCLFFVFGCSTNTIAFAKSGQPNILFILTDDQGWSSLSCYGNKHVSTPHLDQLASEGMRFTDAYVMPQCTPTRAALLTGEHTARNGMWHVIGWYGYPWARMTEPMFRENLSPEDCRLPHELRKAGYKTGMAGKWHLTTNNYGHYLFLKESASKLFGFDYVAPRGPGSQNEGDKWVDHLTDSACNFMEKNQKNPWFFYLSHHTLHGRVSAPKHLIEKHLASGAPAERLQNATYLAAIEHLDNSIGRLMKKLDELKLRDKTIVVFLSDNGGVDTQYIHPESSENILSGQASLLKGKQEFDSDPLREGKGSVYEGGIRVPCIVRWPGVIKKNSVCKTPIHVVDWFPTLLAAASAKFDESTDGVNLGPLFRGKSIPDRALYWHLPLYDLLWASTPSAIIRKGDWKLIEFFGDRFDADKKYQIGHHIELYNLKQDIKEANNLASRNPEKVSELQKQLKQWLKSVSAKTPQKNPHFMRSKAFQKTNRKQPWKK